jgi:hypothetical protein
MSTTVLFCGSAQKEYDVWAEDGELVLISSINRGVVQVTDEPLFLEESCRSLGRHLETMKITKARERRLSHLQLTP